MIYFNDKIYSSNERFSVIAGLTRNLSCKIGFRKRFRVKRGMTNVSFREYNKRGNYTMKTAKMIGVLCAAAAILFSCSPSDSIGLTITEQATHRHMLQPANSSAQRVRIGDTITLDGGSMGEGTLTIIEIREDSIILEIDGGLLFPFSLDEYGQFEVKFDEELFFTTPTRSSLVEWFIVFENNNGRGN